MNNEFNDEIELETGTIIEPAKNSMLIIAEEVAAEKEAARVAALYPLDWKTIDVSLADGRYVHTLARPTNDLILEREDELNQDITIDKKGGYLLPDATETEEIDAKFYERLAPNAKGYSGKIPELHKATAFQGLFESNVYVDEECDIFGDEITVVEEIGNFVIKHTLRGADEAEVKKFRRKNNNRKIERDRRGRQKLVQTSQLRPAMEMYQTLFARMEGAKVNDLPYSDERRAEFIANVNPIIQRAVVKAYIEELTGNLLD